MIDTLDTKLGYKKEIKSEEDFEKRHAKYVKFQTALLVGMGACMITAVSLLSYLSMSMIPTTTTVVNKNKEYTVKTYRFRKNKSIETAMFNSDSSIYSLRRIYDVDGNGKIDTYTTIVLAENDMPLKNPIEIPKQITPKIQKEFEEVMKEHYKQK